MLLKRGQEELTGIDSSLPDAVEMVDCQPLDTVILGSNLGRRGCLCLLL